MVWRFLTAQGVPSVVSEVAVDAQTLRVSAVTNATVGAVSRADGGIAFVLSAKSLPYPVAPEAEPVLAEFGVESALNREVLKVTGLGTGRYAVTIDGERVGTWTADELAAGVGLGFNVRTPQYRQAQAVFAKTAELTRREAKLRNHHSARWFYGNRGAPVDDVAAFSAWFERNEKDKTGYFAKFVPGYLEYWPRHEEVRRALRDEQRTVRALARPQPHRYEITAWDDDGGH